MSGWSLGESALIALDVRNAGVGRVVVSLHVLQKFDEPGIVPRPVLLVDVVGDDGQGAQAVQPGATLVASADPFAQRAVDLHAGHEVFHRLGRIVEAVDGLVDQQTVCYRDILELIHLGDFVRGARRFDARPEPRVVHHVFDLFAEHVSRRLQSPDGLDVLVLGHDSHDIAS